MARINPGALIVIAGASLGVSFTVLVSLVIGGCGDSRRLVDPSPAAPVPVKREVGLIIPCENVETVFGYVAVCFDSETAEYSCRPDTTGDFEINK